MDISDRSPARFLHHHGADLGAGAFGVVIGPPGAGKSALLVHLAIEELVSGRPLLHVALHERVEHVRSAYEEILRALGQAGDTRDRVSLAVAVERNRMVHSYRDRVLDLAGLNASLTGLADLAQFEPRVLIIDGVEAGWVDQNEAGLRALCAERRLHAWVSTRGDRPPGFQGPVVAVNPDGRTSRLIAPDGAVASVDPTTLLVTTTAQPASQRTAKMPRPEECTVYSGGASGAEAKFGEEAAKWGLTEVNFTFEGHKQARTRGRYELSPRELAAGDVSLVYVSKRLNRVYQEGSLIRKVLQTLWHMVARSQQVFVIGEIQDDGTVTGGTGWSVELARMWSKDLWVYDQVKVAWFHWVGQDWVPGTPTIDSLHLTGNGTRYLTADGERAVEELFERSFARRAEAP